MGRPKLEKPNPKCSAPKCRRVARIGGLCNHHHAEASGAPAPAEQATAPKKTNGTKPAVAPGPRDAVKTMLPREAECWGRLFAELTSQKQAAQLYSLQQRELQRQHEHQIKELEQRRLGKLAEAKETQGLYEQVTAELCNKYRVDRQYTVIDVESRVIREERPGA